MIEPELNDIELEIKAELYAFSKSILGKGVKNYSRDLTFSIKKIIGNIGINRGFTIRAGGQNGFEQEWLYDLIWYKRNEIGISNVELIMESELSRNIDEIIYDFEKLLLANSRLKLMICFSNTKGRDIPLIQKRCREVFFNYQNHNQDSRILLLIWDDYNSGEFIPYLLK